MRYPRLPLAVVGLFALAACGTDDAAEPVVTTAAVTPKVPAEPDEPFRLENVPSSPIEVTVSGLDMHRDRTVPDGTPAPLVDFDEIRSGGPPPDGDDAVGIPLADLREAQVITGSIGGRPLVAWWAPGTASALESERIVDGVDVGATGVFVPEADGTPLTFAAAGDGTFTDTETGSTWNLLGEAVDGELAGARLEPYVHVDTFWFAWSTFRPDTEVVAG